MAEQQIYNEARDRFDIIDGGVVKRDLRTYDDSIPAFGELPPGMTKIDNKLHRGDPTRPPLRATLDGETGEQMTERMEHARQMREASRQPKTDPERKGLESTQEALASQQRDEPTIDSNRRMAQEHYRDSEKTVASGEIKDDSEVRAAEKLPELRDEHAGDRGSGDKKPHGAPPSSGHGREPDKRK